ncbi:MAG: translation initiation factor 2 [Xanthobacteraceae bacterium]|nr:translation initiation factor 2 [Xanthobacteraceae bacterium]
MRCVALLACGLALSGCASITRGWNEQIQFSSNPPEANVRTSTGFQCVTPCTLQVGRKDEFTAVFSKAGYISQEVPVRTQLAGAGAAGFAGNVLVGGVVGMGVDVASGAALEHCPNPVGVTLRRAGSKEPPANPGAHCQPPADPAVVAAARDQIN